MSAPDAPSPEGPTPGPPNPEAGEAPPLRLQSCGGHPPPEFVVQGWQVLLQLPPRAQQEMTEVITRSVVRPDDEGIRPALEAICRASEMTAPAGLRALEACRFLFREAAARDLGAEAFARDLEALSGEATQGLRLLGTRYEALRPHLREQLFHESLTDHGAVLVDLDWRMDTIRATNRAQGLDRPVIHLTLELESAEGRERVSMQLPPQSIRLLQSFVRRFEAG